MEETTTGESINLGDFQQLLEKLEASKMRQKRQESVEGRRNLFSQGIANVMSNFWFLLFNRPWLAAMTSQELLMMIGLT